MGVANFVDVNCTRKATVNGLNGGNVGKMTLKVKHSCRLALAAILTASLGRIAFLVPLHTTKPTGQDEHS